MTPGSKDTRAGVPLFALLFLKPFLDFFQAFLEVSALSEELFVSLGFWTFGLGSSILGSFIAVSRVCTLAMVT